MLNGRTAEELPQKWSSFVRWIHSLNIDPDWQAADSRSPQKAMLLLLLNLSSKTNSIIDELIHTLRENFRKTSLFALLFERFKDLLSANFYWSSDAHKISFRIYRRSDSANARCWITFQSKGLDFCFHFLLENFRLFSSPNKWEVVVENKINFHWKVYWRFTDRDEYKDIWKYGKLYWPTWW